MSNPVQAAILHDKRLDTIREGSTPTDNDVPILVWNNCELSHPPERKIVVITNDQSILVGMKVGDNNWKCGTKNFTFEQFPKWAEHPNFARTTKKTAQVQKAALSELPSSPH